MIAKKELITNNVAETKELITNNIAETKEFITNNVDETKAFGAELARSAKPGDVFVLNGDLGAGKTQLVQGFAQEIGVSADVVSPTFNILLEYTDGRVPLYHFDLYRLEAPEDLDDIAFYEMVESDGVSFIEWGEKFPDEMPEDATTITLEVLDPQTRKISVC